MDKEVHVGGVKGWRDGEVGGVKGNNNGVEG